MKRIFFYSIFVLLFSTIDAFSQSYGNEWINYNQKYYSFNIFKTGIYKLDYTTLSNSGIPISTFTSSNIQLFGKEREVPLYISDGGDSSIDPGDYILFYAEKNDGWLDSTLYQNEDDIGNPAYSLFNDTIRYFFTWNTSNNNLRFVEEQSVDFTNYTPSNFILKKVETSYNNFYNQGGGRISIASSSFYKGGEGFGNTQQNGVNGSGQYTLNLTANTISLYNGLDAPLSKFLGISTTNSEASYTGSGNHHLRWKIGNQDYVLHDEILIDYKHVLVKKDFSSILLNNGITSLKWSIIDDQGSLTDFQSLNYWSIIYPKTPTLDGLNKGDFWVKNNTIQSKIRLDLSNTTVTSPIVFIFGDSKPKKAKLTSNNGVYSTLFSNSTNGKDQYVVVQDLSLVVSISSLKPVNGTSIFTDFSTIDSDSALLMIYSPVLETQSLEYQSYRNSNNGGGYNTVLANIEELYLQFGGGIVKHINGIRRFSFFMYDKSNIKPVGLFLMGKGVALADNGSPYGTRGSRINLSSYNSNLIPTFGEPASDVAITADIKNGGWSPLIPTGRIDVKTNDELKNYLNKIKEYESKQDPNSIYSSSEKDWQKQILHFGGGSNAYQQTTFQGYLNSMQESIESASFGGKVKRIYKNSSLPFDPTLLTDITAKIQQGVSLITLFGHAASSGFEINIDSPSNWHNIGKYPILIANTCYTGNMYTNAATPNSITQFVNVTNGGAIAFVGSSWEGVDQPLGQYSKELYKQFSLYSYGKSLSEQIKRTIQQLQLNNGNDLLLESASSQMNLNGDPIIRLNWHAKPEIEITEDKIWFLPKKIDLTVDSIEVNIVLTNLGKAIVDTFDLEIKRDFPFSSIDSIYTVKIPSLNYKDTIHFKMAMQPNIGIGINNISISVDIPSLIPEQFDESNNNQVSKVLFINIDGIVPILPEDFAVVPSDSINLKASTINPIADFNSYRFEIDTTDLFNSPEHRFASISGYGGVKEVFPSDWKLVSNNQTAKLVCSDSAVYFWRVALEATNLDWHEQSFQYIKGKTGWGQDHFFQFKNNGFSGLNYNRNIREKEFNVGLADTVFSIVYPAKPALYYTNFNGQQVDYATCHWPSPALNVVVFDGLTHNAWGTRYVPTGSNLNNNFGNDNDNGGCRNRVVKFFSFLQTNTTSLNAFQDMVLNKVPDGSYMLIYPSQSARYSDWATLAPNIFSTFSTLGSDSIKAGRPNYSFIFFCKKGDPNSVVEKYGLSQNEIVTLTAILPKKDYHGSEISSFIGPSSDWGNVYWKQDSLELVTTDSTELHIQAYDIHKSFQFQIDTTFSHKDSILNLNKLINANSFPYIRLSAEYIDTTSFSPAQINHWHVLYDPLPEAAIDGTEKYTWIPNKDTLNEGEKIKFAVDVKNVFTISMDSLLINYWIEDADHIKHKIPFSRRKPLSVNETIRDTIEFSTEGFVGINSLWMEVNPYVNGSVYITDQPEQEHFNNLLQVPFFVRGDNINPILDVTFNGRHILNGDIVSPSSEILISLKDENPFLLMNDISDTTKFGVYLTDPKGVQKRIPFMNSSGEVIMQWIPADEQNKKFKIIYPATFNDNGKYTLMIQGTDRSGNLSGDLQYKINFEVIKESSITYLMNYPNPFSSSTRFVFTLTGSVIPENIIIQIMTVTGKVVREITESELGRIYIGRNISEYDWNGTDEFGDPLANGVYLYRVKAQINGVDIKHRDTGADSYFTKDFGKMYLLR